MNLGTFLLFALTIYRVVVNFLCPCNGIVNLDYTFSEWARRWNTRGRFRAHSFRSKVELVGGVLTRD